MEYLTLAGYLLTVLIELTLVALGIYFIIKHPFKLKSYQESIIMFIIFMAYFLNVLEKLVYFGTESPWFYDIVPFGNLSPLLFTLCFLCIFMPQKVRKYFYAIFSLMILGMIGAGFKNSVERVFRVEHDLYSCIIFDSIAHILIGLFGFYLLRNSIIEFDKKEKVFAISFVYVMPVLAFITNVIFHTRFFGFSIYGEHNIYNMRISSNGYISALVYFIGLTFIVIGGSHFIKLIKKLLKKEGDSVC